MNKPLIAFYDAHADDQAFFQEALSPNYELMFNEAPLTPETVDQAKGAAVLSTHTTSQVSATVMQQVPGLQFVACRTTGFDHVDLKYAQAHHVPVSNVPTYGEATVAEYAFLLLLAAARRLLPTIQAAQTGSITPTELTGHDLSGKTIGIIGTGRIGRHAAGIARGFGLKVLAYDPYPDETAAHELGFTYAPLPELLKQADYITLHAPATSETHHLLGAEQFALMKSTAVLVNTARGVLIDTPALIQALQEHRLGGAALDVLEGEEYLQLPAELHLLQAKDIDSSARQVLGIDILSKLPNVILTSHNAFNTTEALTRIRAVTVENIQAFFAKKPQNLVIMHHE